MWTQVALSVSGYSLGYSSPCRGQLPNVISDHNNSFPPPLGNGHYDGYPEQYELMRRERMNARQGWSWPKVRHTRGIVCCLRINAWESAPDMMCRKCSQLLEATSVGSRLYFVVAKSLLTFQFFIKSLLSSQKFCVTENCPSTKSRNDSHFCRQLPSRIVEVWHAAPRHLRVQVLWVCFSYGHRCSRHSHNYR